MNIFIHTVFTINSQSTNNFLQNNPCQSENKDVYLHRKQETTTLTRKVTMKNENELMIESLEGFINTLKNISVTPKRFEEAKRDAIKYTIKVKKEIGDYDFLNSKEWKQFLVNQKIENIEKDFK